MSQETPEQWQARLAMEYRRQRAEEDDFLLALGNDHSLENIERVCSERIYDRHDHPQKQ